MFRPSLAFLTCLLVPPAVGSAQTPDTAAVLFAIGKQLQIEIPRSSGLYLDFGCRWPSEICASLPSWGADSTTLVNQFADTLRHGFGGGTQRRDVPMYCNPDRGPYAVYVRPPRFDGSIARIVVAVSCSVRRSDRAADAFFRGEELTVRYGAQGWYLEQRRLLFIR